MKFVIIMLAFAVGSINTSKIPPTATPVQLLNLASGNKSDIVYDESTIRNLFLNPKLADRNVVVFSIIGAFRKGKSFLMNYVLRYMYAHYKSVSNDQLINPENWLGDENEPLIGFEWKAGTQRITTGLILWSDVFLHDDPSGEKLAIYLIDTQGLFDHQSSSNDNSRIFSLSTMISSMQILNLQNFIQEDQLQYLQFATEYARYASLDSEKSPFQNLMILIRDWNSPEEYKYGIRGGNAYLKSFLEIHDYQSRELQSVRRYLRNSFDKIDSFLLPYPGKTVARDTSFNGQWAGIDEDFVEGMQDLFRYLFGPKKLTLKKINSVPIKPADLLVYINSYVNNFKNEIMPEATNIYESTLANQFNILIGKSYDVYVEAIASHNAEPQNEDDINKLHADAKAKALQFFKSEKKFGTYSDGMDFKKDLQTRIDEGFKQWKNVSMNFMRILQDQKMKTSQQNNLVNDAKNRDNTAKAELEVAVKKSEEARKALEQARNDSEETRQQSKELEMKLAQSERERSEAIEKERQTSEYLKKMSKDKEFFENQYNEYKQNAGQQLGASLGDSKRELGFESVLGSITSFLGAATPFIAIVGSFFG